MLGGRGGSDRREERWVQKGFEKRKGRGGDVEVKRKRKQERKETRGNYACRGEERRKRKRT